MAASDSVLAMLRAAEVNERVLTAEVERLTLLADARAVALAQMRSGIQALVNEVESDGYFDVGDFDFEALSDLLAQADPDQRGSELLAGIDCVLGAAPIQGGSTRIAVQEMAEAVDALRRLRAGASTASGEG